MWAQTAPAQTLGYLEQLGPQKTPPSGYDDLIHHLRVCPECLEEFEALYAALREERG